MAPTGALSNVSELHNAAAAADPRLASLLSAAISLCHSLTQNTDNVRKHHRRRTRPCGSNRSRILRMGQDIPSLACPVTTSPDGGGSNFYNSSSGTFDLVVVTNGLLQLTLDRSVAGTVRQRAATATDLYSRASTHDKAAQLGPSNSTFARNLMSSTSPAASRPPARPGTTMNISISYAMNSTEAAAAVAGLRRFETMRIIPALVLSILGTVLCAALDAPIYAAICAAALIFVVSVRIHTIRVVRHVRETADASTRPTSVSVSEDGLVIAHQGFEAAAFAWHDVAHCTSTVSTWIFVLKRDQNALLLPQKALEPGPRQQVASFLRTWPKRRYRTTPW